MSDPRGLSPQEPELWSRNIGPSASGLRWMVYLDIKVQQWFGDEEAARRAYDLAWRNYRAAAASSLVTPPPTDEGKT